MDNIEHHVEHTGGNAKNNQQLSGAIILAGIIIAGAILLKGSTPQGTAPVVNNTNTATAPTELKLPVGASDRSVGSANAKVVLVEYADFQCPFCGRFHSDAGKVIMEKYVNTGKIRFVYRDFAFLGPESVQAAQAGLCANEQGKFWEYHNYIFEHQNGENRGAFADANLKTFAKTIGLNTSAFNTCLDSGKYKQAVNDSTAEGRASGVRGTPKAFILKNGKIVSTIDGAQGGDAVAAKLDAALK